MEAVSATAVEKDAHLVRGRMWAADCGVEFQAAGHTARMEWEWAPAPFACTVCGVEVPAGRLVIGAKHVACVPAADWVRDGFEHADNASARWHRDTVRATKLKGDASTANPSAASAAKALAKIDPVKAARFRVFPVGDSGPNPFAHAGQKVLKCDGPLAQAARAWAMAAEVARAGAPAVEVERKAKAAPKPKAVEVGPAPEVPEVVYREVPKASDPVGDRLARIVDHFPARDVEVVPEVLEVRPVAELPECVEEWLGRLVFGPKADYARAYVAHLLAGAPAPDDPGAEWAEKARKRAARVVAQVTR